MGNTMVCSSGDGVEAAYMLTDMSEGGSILLCPDHWLEMVMSTASAYVASLPPEPEPEPADTDERANWPENDPGRASDAPSDAAATDDAYSDGYDAGLSDATEDTAQ